MLNVGKLLSELQRMTVPELQRRYAEEFGEATRSNHKAYLVRRIVWRAQANAEGGLAERARRIREMAAALANDAELRVRAPSGPLAPVPVSLARLHEGEVTKPLYVAANDRLPMPGAMLTREYRGREIRVRVLPNGFDYEGTVYRSLSAVAKVVTGAHWNGYLFFGIENPRKPKPERRTVSP